MIEIVAEVSANVWRVLVHPGDQVTAGHPLLVLESVKMEIPVEAPVAGVVREVRVAEGDVVHEGDVLAVLS